MNVPRISEGDLTSGFPQLWNELAEDVEQHHLAIDSNAAAARSMFNDATQRIDGLNLTLHRAVDRIDDYARELSSDVGAMRWGYGIALVGAYLIGLFA